MVFDAMIEVSGLSKSYAGRAAISDLTFTVGRGEIVGFLGPNGAGKSTTMRILAGYLPASSGTARVAGYDVFTQSLEARRSIGYMPENNPLYHEMRVREYLKFRARLKGLAWRRSRERVDTVLTQCGLEDVSKKVIGHLSKGYRQRVGLADALVHEPDLIILDEPTSGLDPEQLRSVRKLIKDLKGRHTVLLSTHILPEVELTCGRVLIMRQGEILAADTPDELRRKMHSGQEVVAEIAASLQSVREGLEDLEAIEDFDVAEADGEYVRCTLKPRNGADLRPIVFDLAKERGWRLRELSRTQFSLEDIYLRVTRRQTEEEPS
jgi:ABC-2 type transport system ATP-binding protein